MSKRKKSLIGKILYWLLLIIWTAALSYGAYYALTIVWGVAEVYEKSMPEPVVDEYLATEIILPLRILANAI